LAAIRFAQGSFFRSIELPCEIKQENVAANYKHGVLTISLPKCEANKPVTVKSNGK
jgi:HSP20 family protein